MSAPELAACPFCGGSNVKTAYVRDGRKAHCFDCFASAGPEFHGPKDKPSAEDRAIAAWNRRADLHDATALDPDMPADELRLHMGELTDQEVLTARAAIRWANSAHAAQVETLREALGFLDAEIASHGFVSDGRMRSIIARALSAVSRDDTSEVSDG